MIYSVKRREKARDGACDKSKKHMAVAGGAQVSTIVLLSGGCGHDFSL